MLCDTSGLGAQSRESCVGGFPGSGNDGEMAVVVDIGHFGYEARLKMGVVLGNAQGVYPEVPYAEACAESHGVSYRTRDGVSGDRFLVSILTASRKEVPIRSSAWRTRTQRAAE